MRVKPWLVAGLLLVGLGASASSINLGDPRLLPIKKFYEDCTFVAENCSRPQITTVLHMIQNGEEPRYGLLDRQGKRIYAAIHDTQKMILQPDPLIHGPFPSMMAYIFRILSAEVIRVSDSSVSIKVTRETVRVTYRPVNPRGASQYAKPITEIDEWIKVGDTWVLRMLRVSRA